jgi:DNA ligase 1
MKELRQFVDKMQATSSSLNKVEILKQQPEFIKKILEYTYNPYKQFYVTSKTCIKNKNIIKKDYFGEDIDLFETLDQLTTRKVTGHDAIKLVNGFNFHVGEGIYDIIDKDLKIRTGAKVINKAFPGLIPEFNVALAKEYDGKCDWNDHWYASRKLDGVRCLAVVDVEGKCTLYSRMGKEFTTLDKVKHAIEATGIINTVFDGEICLVDDKGDEDFQGIMKQLRRKDHQIKNPAYMLFDMLSNAEFDSCKGDTLLENRLSTLSSWCPEMNYECDDNGQPMHLNILR